MEEREENREEVYNDMDLGIKVGFSRGGELVCRKMNSAN